MRETMGFIDLHTHTDRSDGAYPPMKLITKAKKNKIKVLAITDHNYIMSEKEFMELQKEAGTDITLLCGCEVSCQYLLGNKRVELHMIALFPFPSDGLDEFRLMIAKNRNYDRRPYINGILKNLEGLGIHIGTYEELLAKYGGEYIGRPNLASEMVARGYVDSADAAMDRYIGDFGERLAWYPNTNKDRVCSLEEAIDTVRRAKGLCILAHLYYYKLTKQEERELLEAFRQKTGIIGGMETLYRRYSEEQRNALQELAKEFSLFESYASDYHGSFESDGLDNEFPADAMDVILDRWERAYGKKEV